MLGLELREACTVFRFNVSVKDDLTCWLGSRVTVLGKGTLEERGIRSGCVAVMQCEDELSDNTPHQLFRKEFPYD